MKKLTTSATLLAALLSGQQAVAADSAVINFTATLGSGGYSGVESLDPFIAGTPTYDLVNGTGFFSSPASPDWLSFDGQITISDFQGDGTYTIGGSGNDAGGIYFVSPLLNRIEAVSLRTEGPLTAESQALGAGRRDGQALGNRDDIYLPDFTPNGVATVTISGNDVTLDYLLDFSTLPITNAEWLRNGDTPTQISGILAANNARFASIGASGSGSILSVVSAKGAFSSTPFGGYTSLSADVGGNLSNTIVPTTIELLNNEIAAGNITSDGRLVSDPTTPTEIFDPLTNPLYAEYAPFFADVGDFYFYDLTGTSINASVSVVPAPAAVWLWLCGSGLLALLRRKQLAAYLQRA